MTGSFEHNSINKEICERSRRNIRISRSISQTMGSYAIMQANLYINVISLALTSIDGRKQDVGVNLLTAIDDASSCIAAVAPMAHRKVFVESSSIRISASNCSVGVTRHVRLGIIPVKTSLISAFASSHHLATCDVARATRRKVKEREVV